ncbi:putative FAD-dependent oxidoreductase [BD1-7 clade bacterium]|uniref:Putative FAD-dependent oxidoreductase n=1 Tax=BD1-7 clade bacterium TaxID=2029982 RepID=A0A5S9NMA9_9GAMM|nr:putative FAD-dependent oxidoreductase [BD1-7 clade bacterium]CAA0093765.1 putative FAD-dependent oxidoreductase [BD1-7 clade bacterium]
MNTDPHNHSVDLVIIGGGIAGLWTLAEARASGINAILFEKADLGCGQTIASQGIIHGGSKYALAAKMTKAGNVIGEMPKRWKNAIGGKGDVLLNDIKTLAQHQYLVPTNHTDTKLLSFLGSKTMASRTKTITHKHLPDAYKAIGLDNSIYQLNEIVLDIGTVLTSFLNQYQAFMYQVEVNADDIGPREKNQYSIKTPAGIINTQHILLAAGEGYEHLNIQAPAMQKRPLQMVMAKGDLPPIFAHFVGRSNKPILTVTSHASNGKTVWYMGGNLAEEGVDKSASTLIDEARHHLNQMMPSVDTDQLSFGTFHVNRAEPAMKGLVRPDDAFIQNNNNIIVGWPTKLALAPRFAEKVVNEVHATSLQLIGTIEPVPVMLQSLPRPGIAKYPWHDL